MPNDAESLPSDLAAAHAMILAERAARLESEARATQIEADLSHSKAAASGVDALVVHLRLEIEKLRRALYGVRSERKQRLLDQLELQLEDAEAGATEDELAAERSAPSTLVKSFERRRPVRKPFPEHLPRERVVIAAPASCPCCGSTKLSKLGEDVTETLEVVPRQWKVIQTVRERFSCRQCETITQPPAPFHVTPRGFAGPNLLAMILFEKFGQHQPLNRQSERYAREGIDLSLSTLADQVGACATALRPLHALIEGARSGRRATAWRRHHGSHPRQGQDGNRPDLGLCPRRSAVWRHRTRRRRCSTPRAIAPANIPNAIWRAGAAFCKPTLTAATTASISPIASRGRSSKRCAGATRRRKFFELADIAANARRGKNAAPISPIALEAVRRIDVIFDVERDINGQRADERLRVRREVCRRSGRGAGDLDARRARQAVAPRRGRQGARLHADALAGLHPLPRRRQDLPDQQCRRKGAARPRSRQEIVAVRRIRARRRTRRRHVHAHSDREAQRRRPASLARRRPLPDRRHFANASRRAAAVELALPRSKGSLRHGA